MKTVVRFLFLFCTVTLVYSCNDKGQVLNRKDEGIINNGKEINHLEYIRSKSEVIYPGGKETYNGKDYPRDSIFIDYVVNNFLEEPEHVKYISDRELLRKLNNKVCWDNYVLIQDTLDDGRKCRIEIRKDDFDTIKHVIEYYEDSGFTKTIDSLYLFGAVYGKYPSKEIKEIIIEINNKEIFVPKSAYQNLYAPNFCNFGSFIRILEVYVHGENIYIYLFGGNAADTYFAKLIFTPLGFKTSIILDYVPMSNYGSFSERFIGF